MRSPGLTRRDAAARAPLTLGLVQGVGLPCAVAVAAAALVAASRPWALLGAATVAVGLAVVGTDAAICVAALASFGLIPFVKPDTIVVGGIPVWLVAFAFAAGLMLISWSARHAAGQPAWRLEASGVVLATLALLVYTALRLSVGSPLDIPSLSAPFLAFPLAAVVTFLWLSHPQATANLRKVLPLAAGLVALWAVAYISGSAGLCGECRGLVGTVQEGTGLLGSGSRLYTLGQDTLLGIVLVLFGYALFRPSPPLVGVTVLAYLAVALQASRAQYAAVAVGTAILLLWKFSTVKPLARALLVLVTALAIYAIVSGPVGERALSGYQELRQSSGTAGYRLTLLEESSTNWTLLGVGVSSQTPNLGVDFDLGLPNTLVILGFAGALLQLAVLVLALLRGLRSRSVLGVSLGAVVAMVLVARPSLPLIENGSSAVAYGMAVGFIAALWLTPAAQTRSATADSGRGHSR
jgi:hypothetical protein